MWRMYSADYSIILLVRGGNLSGTHSYQSLVQSTFGQIGYLIVSALQFLYPFIGYHYILPVLMTFYWINIVRWSEILKNKSLLAFVVSHIAMISYNIITGDTLTKVFMRIQGGELVIIMYF